MFFFLLNTEGNYLFFSVKPLSRTTRTAFAICSQRSRCWSVSIPLLAQVNCCSLSLRELSGTYLILSYYRKPRREKSHRRRTRSPFEDDLGNFKISMCVYLSYLWSPKQQIFLVMYKGLCKIVISSCVVLEIFEIQCERSCPCCFSSCVEYC